MVAKSLKEMTMFLTRFVLVVGVAAFGLLVLSPSPVMAADAKVMVHATLVGMFVIEAMRW